MRGLCAIAMIGWTGAQAHADRRVATGEDSQRSIAPRDTQLSFDAGRLSATAKTALEPVVEVLRTRSELRIVVVGSFATKRMEATTKRRVNVVKWFIVDAGIEADRIDTHVASGRGDMVEVQLDVSPAETNTSAAVTAGAVLGVKLVFEPARVRLAEDSKTELGPMLDRLRAHPSERVTIVGNFDAAGPEQEATAKRRVENVKWYLADNGIETDRITTTANLAAAQGNVVEIQFDRPAVGSERRGSVGATPSPDDREPVPAFAHAVADPSAADAIAMAMLLTDGSRGKSGPPRHAPRLPQFDEPQVPRIGGDGEVGFRNDRGLRFDVDHASAFDLASPTLLDSTPKHSEQAPSRVTAGSTSNAAAAIGDDGVVRRVHEQYMPAMARCYRKRFGGSAARSSTVELVFTVDRAGRVLKPSAHGSDAEIDGCIRSQMSRWDFPVTRDRGGAPTPHTFSVSVVLKGG